MAKTFTHYTTVSLGSSEGSEFGVTLSFSVAWGSPETGRFGRPEDYDPGCGSEVEDIKVQSIEGLTSGWGDAFACGFQTDQQIAEAVIEALTDSDFDRMLDEASEDAYADAIEAEEYRAESRRDAARYYGEA
jgi:hypothetical protein